MNPLKVPGLDGMSGIFYRKYRDIIGEQIIAFVQEFFKTGKLVKSINHTFICRIPKRIEAINFDHFRPISLCNFCYKIVACLLATRMRKVIGNLVAPCQTAFVLGRWIAECSITAQELLHTLKKHKGKNGIMGVKIDMHKAYDRIEWSFLERVLKANRFYDFFCQMIMQCVTAVNFSILLNGSPLQKFQAERGL